MMFYKWDGLSLSETPSVYAPGYTLTAENHGDHTYPVDGWHWFGTADEARANWGLPPPPGALTPEQQAAAAVKAEASARIGAVLKDAATQRNMTALSVAILRRQLSGKETQQDVATLALLDTAFAWVGATQQAGRDRIAGTNTPWPEPPAGLVQLVAAL